MKISKRILVYSIVVIMITVFAGCSKKESNIASENITIRMDQFSADRDKETVLREIIAEFNKTNPDITVDLQSFGYDDYFTQLQTKVVGGKAADIFELNFENFVAYASEDVLYDISALMGDTSSFNTTALNAFRYGNRQYGIPNSFSNVVLIYNKDLFDRAGIPYPNNNWTWKDMEEAGIKIRALDRDIFGLVRPVTFHEFYKAARQSNSSLTGGGKFTVNTPQNIAALEEMVSWQSRTNIMPTAAQSGGMGPNWDWDLFKSGRLGMLVNGIWAFDDFKRNVTFPWDIAVEPGNPQKGTHFFSNAYVVNRDSKNPEPAVKLAVFLAGSKEASRLRVEKMGDLPPVIDNDVLKAYLTITPPDNKQAVFDSLNYLVTPPVAEQQSEMQDIISKYLELAVSGKESAKNALDACQKELEERIKLY